MPISLGELAVAVGCELVGDPETVVTGVASLKSASAETLTFLSSPAYSSQLPATQAAAVVLRAEDAAACPTALFISKNPYATYARMAALVCAVPPATAGIHSTAVIAETATVSDSAHIAAMVVIGEGSSIGENCFVGPGTVVGTNCSIGDNCELVANVSVVQDVTVGSRCILHPGVVLGSDGFGNAMTGDGWVKVPQVGGVKIGSDVEIGANSTVDRGAIGDTVIEDGVRIDNLCMIAHNVCIGEHTALAAMTGIAGSAIIGKRCLFAGKSGTVGHVTVCDDVIVSAKTFVSKDISEPGTYSAAFPAVEAKSWAKQLARFRRLGVLIERVRKLER